jgi:hypothetical protein
MPKPKSAKLSEHRKKYTFIYCNHCHKVIRDKDYKSHECKKKKDAISES